MNPNLRNLHPPQRRGTHTGILQGIRPNEEVSPKQPHELIRAPPAHVRTNHNLAITRANVPVAFLSLPLAIAALVTS